MFPRNSYFRFPAAAIVICLIPVSPGAHAAEPERTHAAHGSPYVPLDSWTYPVFRRLADMGYMPDQERLTAPWTRRECRMLLDEAKDIASRRSTKLAMKAANNEALRLIAALEREFSAEAPTTARLESLYTRYAHISGMPLRDSYHFGQSIVDDYGRPYGPGANIVNGVSAYATWGRFSGYARAEYQQAPGLPAYSPPVRNFIAAADQIPAPPGVPSPSEHRFDALEAYAGVQLGSFNITAGKESIWWGPGADSAFHFSNNAEPIYMVRVDQTMPFLLPGALRLLGRIRTQFLVGRLAGHEFPPHPLINAQKITLQLTPNLELGFTRSAIFGGAGHPVTARSFFRSLLSASSSGGTAFGSANDPGDRRSGFDFSWHLPKLRHYITIYSDSLADDEPNPLDAPRRSAWGPGIYLTRIPGLPKVDFRLETYSTWLYAKDHGGGFIYWNDQYHDAYTNNGNVLGSWIGRDARAYTASSTYWFSAKDKLTASYRQVKTGGNFLPGGGTQTDAALSGSWQIHLQWLLTAFAQYERYYVPVLGPPQRNVSAGLQVTFYPANWKLPHR